MLCVSCCILCNTLSDRKITQREVQPMHRPVTRTGFEVGRAQPASVRKYPFTFLLVYFSKKKKRVFFCASLLLKMNLGINFLWILGSSSTFRLFNSYRLLRARTSPKK